MSDNFIELDRQFILISEGNAAAEDFEARITHENYATERMSWQGILAKRRSVIIAEAGAGKTEELKQQTKRLRNQGRHAFFLRLEYLWRNFEASFEGAELGDFGSFQIWHQSNEKAWFFLDSVDEAKLRDHQDFRLALLNFNKELGLKREQAHIIVTSRLTWEPSTDFNLIKQHLPYQPQKSSQPIQTTPLTDSKTEKLQIYSLVRLDEERIKHFIKERHINNPDAFMAALDHSNTQSFAARPKDLNDLITYWEDHKKIDSPLEIVKYNIKKSLLEDDTNRSEIRHLNQDKARCGARRIAAATSLTHYSRIAVPDQNQRLDAISASNILKDWEPKERKTLLEKSIFDEAIYGMVRFHHRSVREYLAAEWFLECLKSGSRRNILQLFFRKQYDGLEYIAPSLSPILPWISIYDDEFRQKTLKIAPDILLEGGDSSQFPLATRQQILIKTCEQLASNKAKAISFDLAVIQRFARNDLEETVHDCLEKYSDRADIQIFLLKMVSQGRYSSCIDQALLLASNEQEDTYTRIAAIQALHAAGTADQQAALIDYFVSQAESVNARIMVAVIMIFPPTILNISQLSSILEKLEYTKYDSLQFEINEALKKFIDRLKRTDLEDFADQLAGLLKDAPHIKRYGLDISEKHQWLTSPISWVLKRLIEERSPHLFSKPMLTALSSLSQHQIILNCQYNTKTYKDLPTLMAQWPELNTACFWHDVALVRQKSDHPIQKYQDVVSWSSFRSLDDISFDLAMDWIKTKQLLDDKHIALDIAFLKYTNDGRERKKQEQLERLVAKTPELAKALDKLLHSSSLSAEEKEIEKQMSDFARRQKQQEEEAEKKHNDWKAYLRNHIDEIRDTNIILKGESHQSQRYLYEYMRENNENDFKYSQTNWYILIEDHSLGVTWTFRSFLINCAKIHDPGILSEGKQHSDHRTYPTLFGLSGLEIETTETRNWAEKLSKDEAQHIIRYVFHEINGPPSWLQKFYAQFPDIVEEHFIQEIACELTRYNGECSLHPLSTLYYHCNWFHTKLAKPLLNILQNHAIKNAENLTHALQIILADKHITKGDVTELASKRARDNSDIPITAIWFAVWLSASPKEAITALNQKLAEIHETDKEAATEFAIKFSIALLGERDESLFISLYDDFKTPHSLCKLYFLLHNYIRQDEDIGRTNEPYRWLEPRDHAQKARDAILPMLAETPGKETYLALQEIANKNPTHHQHAWINRQLIAHARKDADISKWSIDDVIDFEETSEKTPQTAEELFKLSINRLQDLKDWLEDGEDSLAAMWQQVTKETELRNAIAVWLKDKSHNRYSIHQEEEQADGKKPDIRFHTLGVDAPVPVELKIADNWSGSGCFERLENQLCNDYLRDHRTHYGIFLLSYRGIKTHWEHPETKVKMDFPKLIEELQNKAENILEKRSDIDDIGIIGIDLTKRQKAIRSKKK